MPKALIIEPVHPVLLTSLKELGYDYTLVKHISKDDALSQIGSYEGLITSNKLYVDKDIIDAGIQLKWIGRMGSGMEIIDVPYATSKGIYCVNSPEGNANAVAEQALGMLLCLLHNVVKSHLELQDNIWLRDENRGSELNEKIVGLIGYGNNGSRFGEKLLAMGCRVIAFDPYITIQETDYLKQAKHIEEVYDQADILSYHVPLTQETYHYFNDSVLNSLKKSVYLLNLSRGAVVDLNTVSNGLENGKILGCGIDVWEEEPVVSINNRDAVAFSKIKVHPHAIVTAHIGGYSHEATYKMSFIVAEKLRKYLDIN